MPRFQSVAAAAANDMDVGAKNNMKKIGAKGVPAPPPRRFTRSQLDVIKADAKEEEDEEEFDEDEDEDEDEDDAEDDEDEDEAQGVS